MDWQLFWDLILQISLALFILSFPVAWFAHYTVGSVHDALTKKKTSWKDAKRDQRPDPDILRGSR